MPNLYKMAKAFGKAMAQPDNPKMMDMISEGRINSNKPENRAFRKAWDDEYDYLKANEELPLRERIPDDDADIQLQKDFDEAFDEALKGAADRQHSTNRGDLLGTVNDIEDDFREQAIEMLKEGRPIEDVLDILEQTGYQRPKIGRVTSGE